MLIVGVSEHESLGSVLNSRNLEANNSINRSLAFKNSNGNKQHMSFDLIHLNHASFQQIPYSSAENTFESNYFIQGAQLGSDFVSAAS